MEKLLPFAFLAVTLIAGPAMADDFPATCKANPPTGMDAASYNKFCDCIAKESAGNDQARAEFLAMFKIKDLETRKKTVVGPAQGVAQKCSS